MQSDYESQEQVAQYCEFHYGKNYFEVPNFPCACVVATWQACGKNKPKRVLDMGCSVGRSSVEFARLGAQVLGVDYSQAFVDTAAELVEKGALEWSVVEEGEITQERSITLDQIGGTGSGGVSFAQGDACAMREDWTGYDLITGFNLLCRLPEPVLFLEEAVKRLNPSGVLALTTPATWLESFTPRENWLGGYYREGEAVRTLDGIRAVLELHCEPVGEVCEVPFVIRETSRKYQHSSAQFSAWRKL